MHIEQVSMISLQNTRDKRAASMPNKPCFLPRSIRINKTVQILARFDCDLKALTMLISGCGQSFAHAQWCPTSSISLDLLSTLAVLIIDIVVYSILLDYPDLDKVCTD